MTPATYITLCSAFFALGFATAWALDWQTRKAHFKALAEITKLKLLLTDAEEDKLDLRERLEANEKARAVLAAGEVMASKN